MNFLKPFRKDLGVWIISLGLLMAVDSLMASSTKITSPSKSNRIAKADAPATKAKDTASKTNEISAEHKKALFEAASANNIEALEKTIKDSKITSADIKNANGSTLLEVAMVYEGIEAVKTLLKLNFDPSYRDEEGRSYLDVATLLDSSEVLELLIGSKKFDINMQDSKGNTVLHNAVIAEKSPMVKIILKNSPKKDIKNKAGETAKDLAVKSGDKALAKLLK